MSKIATRSKTAIETNIEENDLELDIYDLPVPLDQIEEIVYIAKRAREFKQDENKAKSNYKPLAVKISEFLVKLGSPKKVNGPSFKCIKQTRSETSLDSMKLVKEEGVSVEAIERCTVTKTVTYYKLVGIKDEEEDIENVEGE